MRTLLRILIKIFMGFTCAVAVLTLILMFLVHLPESEKVKEFEKRQDAFEEVNLILRGILEDRDRERMVFYFDFEAHNINDGRENGEIFYTGEAVDELMRFGTSMFDSVYVYKEKTVFSYGRGLLSIVYMKNGHNPGSFEERFVDFTTKSYKLKKKWFYTMLCDNIID